MKQELAAHRRSWSYSGASVWQPRDLCRRRWGTWHSCRRHLADRGPRTPVAATDGLIQGGPTGGYAEETVGCGESWHAVAAEVADSADVAGVVGVADVVGGVGVAVAGAADVIAVVAVAVAAEAAAVVVGVSGVVELLLPHWHWLSSNYRGT